MATHAIARQGPGGTAALAETQIGADIVLPAGGPWLIHHVWGQVVRKTTIPDQGAGGILHVQSLSGDLDPDPAPGKYPLPGPCVSESANSAIAAVPLFLFPVDWTAAGKASLSLSYIQQLAITTASEVACGILFGTERPESRPLKFGDYVQASWAGTAEQAIGTITLAEKASRIVGIFADLNKGDAATAGEEIMATVRLDSADIAMPPAQYPCNRAFNASDGTAVGQSATPWMQHIPLDIPVVGGARIDVFATSSISVTGNADITVHLFYE
jgi:hypothetical protein